MGNIAVLIWFAVTILGDLSSRVLAGSDADINGNLDHNSLDSLTVTVSVIDTGACELERKGEIYKECPTSGPGSLVPIPFNEALPDRFAIRVVMPAWSCCRHIGSAAGCYHGLFQRYCR